jgi:hypothetical protein
MAQRYEVLKIDALENIEKTPEGFLRLPARATRTGVFVYRKADGTLRKEFRSPEEVFNADSLATLLAKPVTNNHPKEGRVDASNAKQHTVGFTSDSIQEDGKFVKLFLNILDEDTVDDIKNGKRELSCGYTCEVTDSTGESDGETYDAVQKNIQYNHVALVHRGSAGSQVRLNLDSEDAVLEEDIADATPQIKNQKTTHKEDTMETTSIKIDGQAVTVPNGAAVLMTRFIQKQQSRIDDLEKELEKGRELKTDLENTEMLLDKAQGKIKGYKASVTELEKKLDTFDAQVKEKAVERARLQKTAESVLDADSIEKLDEMSTSDIKKAVISKKTDLNLDNATETHIDACFEVICNLKEAPKNALGAGIIQNRSDEASENKADARDRAKERQKNAYKGEQS